MLLRKILWIKHWIFWLSSGNHGYIRRCWTYEWWASDIQQRLKPSWSQVMTNVARGNLKGIWGYEKTAGVEEDTKSSMPLNHRCMNNMWVFKINHNGVYWACLVACCYSQEPRLNFSKSFLSIVNNITFCILLLIVIHVGLLVEIVNTKTAFLHEELEEDIHMECPHSMSDVSKDDWFILIKCLYGLIQASSNTTKRHWNFKDIRICWRQSEPMPLCKKVKRV